ncbi:MAG: hypothetical protein NC400_10100 [Clostridium sp.]|nr:hypothetical protein [Clostridium sp.]
MKVINYWEKFLSTGSINDYLNYRGEEAAGCSITTGDEKPAKHSAFARFDKVSKSSESKEIEGAGKVEGTSQRYRDNIESGTHRGV